VRWRKASIAVITLLLAIGALAGCVESDPESAQTPTSATTVQNSAAQTDSEGNTVSAPAGGGGGEEAPPAGGGSEDDNAGEGEGGGAMGDAQAGVALFTSTGCGSCHTFGAASASGAIGPNLDEALAGKSPEEIKTDITDPDAEITEGFPPGVMPGNYGDTLSDDDLNNLVAALSQ
jgi:cytochrome c553